MFSAAAERLGLSSSQVSRQVARLEERLQTRLFYRSTRKVALTEAGQTADADKVAALAHKMLPLFTLLQAAEAAALLAWLEQQRGTAYCEEINTKIAAALRATEEVVEQALLIKSQYTL